MVTDSKVLNSRSWAASLCLSVALLLPSMVFSQQWHDLARERTGLIRLDTSSVQRSNTGTIEALWAIETRNTTTTYVGIINCAESSVRLTRKIEAFKNFSGDIDSNRTVATDYEENSVVRGGIRFSLNPLEALEKISYPSIFTGAGHVLRELCNSDNVFQRIHVTGGESVRNGICERFGKERAACTSDRQLTMLLGHIFYRFNQIEKKCAIEESVYGAAFDYTLQRLTRCTSENCVKSILIDDSIELGKDLQSADHGQLCVFTNALANRARSSQQLASFRQCILTNASPLDDGISPADVIARALFSYCRDQEKISFDQDAGFQDFVLPDITAEVLKGRRDRAAARK